MQIKSVITMVIVCIISLGIVGVGAYSLGARSIIGTIIGASNEALVLDSIELRYERAISIVLRNNQRIRNEATAGQIELGRLRRERDAARAELDAYYTAVRESFDLDSIDYNKLRSIGSEFLRRIQESN